MVASAHGEGTFAQRRIDSEHPAPCPLRSAFSFFSSPFGGNRQAAGRGPHSATGIAADQEKEENHDAHRGPPTTNGKHADRVYIFDTTLRDGEQSPASR